MNPVNHLHDREGPTRRDLCSIDPTLRREFQALALRVVTERPTTVTWTIDGATLATASSERSVDWPLVVGSHQIEVRDTGGRSARTSVVVK